jgi:hypothetical protein
MNKLAPPPRWYAPWRAAAATQDDPADLGTAFGLDLSMTPMPGPAAPVAAAAGRRRAGWVQRWVTRRRAAT